MTSMEKTNLARAEWMKGVMKPGRKKTTERTDYEKLVGMTS